MGLLPPENTLEDVKIKIKKSYHNSNVGLIKQVVLKEGPQAFRIATLLEILGKDKKSVHHYSLKIDQIDRSKQAVFFKVVVIICLLIKQLLFLDLSERHQQVHSF
ncbi:MULTISPECIES: hypothetical protein [unclassified Vibrio]|uniref:hypothetical protein n=1 Tax=unclassified Vibrio TaxID=2614977 RepID=UPI00352FC042